ncbi:MAG: hypothetical protein QM662_12705 [Gordonia sp. (in: high G+C Gram-positive bacteria)]
MERRLLSERETHLLTIVSGLLAAVALAQLSSVTNGGIAPGAFLGGLLAIVTAVAVWLPHPFPFVAEICYFGIAVIALIPAAIHLFRGSGCSGGLDERLRWSAVICFTLIMFLVSIVTITLRWSWWQIPRAGLGWVGALEAMAFWLEPGPWSSGSDLVGLGVAIVAGAGAGGIVGYKPAVGLAVIGVFLAIFSIAANDQSVACASPTGEIVSAGLTVTYLVVSGLLLALVSRLPKFG